MRPGHPATLQGFDSYSCGTVRAPDVLPRNVTAVGLSSFKYLRSNAVGRVSGEGVREDLQRAVDAVDAERSAGSFRWQWGEDMPKKAPKWLKKMERETGVEPATFSLGS